jgi:hypothetical protein
MSVPNRKLSEVEQSTRIWCAVKADLLAESKKPVWGPEERAAIVRCANIIATGDRRSKIIAYLTLVRALAPEPTRPTIVVAEMGRIIAWLDPHAYDSKPIGDPIRPEDFIQQYEGNAEVRRRFDRWGPELAQRLESLHFELKQVPPARVANFPAALLDLVSKLPKGVEVAPEVRVVCDAIRRGKAGMTHIPQHDLVGIYWPASQTDFPELLTAKEAINLLEVEFRVEVAIRTLAQRAVARPALKSGSKYVKAELLRAARDKFFDHGNKRS